MTLHIRSDKELTRLEVRRDLASGRLTTSAAAGLLGLERRQVQRLASAYQEQGATALISKKRGRASNRQMPTDIKVEALELIKNGALGPSSAVPARRHQQTCAPVVSMPRRVAAPELVQGGHFGDRLHADRSYCR